MKKKISLVLVLVLILSLISGCGKDDAFKVDEVFDVALTYEELNEKERLWIEMYQTDKFGYNSTKGNK